MPMLFQETSQKSNDIGDTWHVAYIGEGWMQESGSKTLRKEISRKT
jgi:hypothetical protein